jgi:hypothetical protein
LVAPVGVVGLTLPWSVIASHSRISEADIGMTTDPPTSDGPSVKARWL